jgi:phosphotransferase system HPr-like phosphotransfer protein
MPEFTPIETVVREQEFVRLLATHGSPFFQLMERLRRDSSAAAKTGSQRDDPAAATGGGEVDDARTAGEGLHKAHYFHLIHAANELETFLDDHGARYNRTFRFFTEVVAGMRGFGQSGYRLAHLAGRLRSYGAERWPGGLGARVDAATRRALAFVERSLMSLVATLGDEQRALGLPATHEPLPEPQFVPVQARTMLPRNVGQDDLLDEEQKIAEVASKFLQACDLLVSAEIRPLRDVAARHTYLASVCTEEQARVYEATVHNLQSTYDTYVKNTVLEARDARLPALRGYASATLHLLEAVTLLTHFHERHESEARATRTRDRMAELIERADVEQVVLEDLLVTARELLEAGRAVAEDLLPSYLTVQEMVVELNDGVTIHARPAALIVGIVNHHGTPVQMQVGDRRCNAGSILELLVTVGANPNVRVFTFCGDQHPLRDIALLFEHGLGESGIDQLPPSLAYLRAR